MYLVLVRTLIVFSLCRATIAEPKQSKESENLSEPLTNESLNETSKIRTKRGGNRKLQPPVKPMLSRIELSGIPGTFTVLLDTCSASIWVASDLCVSIAGVGVSHSYPNPDVISYKVSKYYKNYYLLGQQVRHHVTFGGLILSEFLLEVIHAMNPIPPLFGQYEGVFGLAPVTEFPGDCESFCCWLKRCQPLGKRFFTLRFPGANNVEYAAAEFSIGQIEPAHYHEPLIYFEVTSAGLWSIKVTKIILGDKPLCEADCEIILDTGTGISYGDPDALESIATYIGATGQINTGEYIIDCAGSVFTPWLKVFVGHQHFSWRSQELTLKIREGSRDQCYFGLRPDSQWIQGRWTFGHNLLRALYTVYDVEAMKVGVARAKFHA